MIKRGVVVMALAVAAWGGSSGIAFASQDPDAKKAESVPCQSGTLAGETISVVSNKAIFTSDGTQLRLTSVRFEFDGRVKEKTFGKTLGSITCGGSQTSPEGTFSYFATLTEA